METQKFIRQNPWWTDKEWIDKDKHLRKKKASKLDWSPRLRFFFKFNKDAIYTLRGPRQVGKTTLVKTMIKERLESGVEGRRVFYWTCDLVSGSKELASMLESYVEWAKSSFDGRLFLFLDEISSVKDWQKGIKYLVDTGSLENCTIFLTGSHSLDIRKASERLPGRRGIVDDVLDKILPPMKFSEYIDVRSKKLRNVIRSLDLLTRLSRQRAIFQLAKAIIPKEIKELSLYSNELSRLFEDYLITGGVAPAIDSYISEGKISTNIYETYVSVMLGDAMRWQKKEVYMAQIIRRIIESLSSQVSWKSLGKQTDLGSHHTVAEYVDVLESSFVVSCIYRLDKNKGVPYFSKEKKIHFQDPFIFHALRGWSFSLPYYQSTVEFLGNTEDRTKLVESVICNHLIRMAFNLMPSSEYKYTNKVTYWTSKHLREVDFAVRLNDKFLPIEVKCKSAFNRTDLFGLYGFIKGGSSYGGIVVTKDLLKTRGKITFIPNYLFLTLI